MYEKRIRKIVDDIFFDIKDSDEVREQKEELRIHLSERVEEYMANGAPFDEAMARAKASLGDPEELVAGFERRKTVEFDEVMEDYGLKVNFRFNRLFARLTPLAPFLYIILGITESTWSAWAWVPEYPVTWWAWGWVIIPVIPILSSGFSLNKLTALSPFIYVMLGFWFMTSTWWLWGWIIIPVSAILFGGMGGMKKKKKKKWKINTDFDIEIQEAVKEVRDAVQEVREELREELEELDEEFGRRN